MDSSACLVSHEVLLERDESSDRFLNLEYGQAASTEIAESTCSGLAAMPSLPADEIDASFGRRDRERHRCRRSGTRPERADFATTVCAYRWQNAFSLVRRILRDE